MCKCTPQLNTPFCGKPGCQWPPQKLEVVTDHMAERLDELAALGEVWSKNRARGHNPVVTRSAMLMAARELVAMADMDALAGPG